MKGVSLVIQLFKHTTNGRNLLIFGAYMSFSVHATNRANHIYLMGEGLTRDIHDTTIYVEKNYYRTFIDHGKKFVLSLHYNADDSYLFVNGKQELKFKAKNDQLVKEKLCIGNFSDQWTTSESEKTGLYENIYDFAVDYEAIIGVGPTYDMHRLVSLTVSLFNLVVAKVLECVSVVNEKCLARPKIINTNANEPVFYPLSIKVNKFSSDCNTINDPMAKLCVPDVTKDLNVKVFNMLARINGTRKLVWHETCKCICRLASATCNDQQDWNKNKCVCKCKEDLVSKLVCDKGYMWNPGTCACECDKYCEVGQYLDYSGCVCRKKLIDDLIEQCTSVVDMEIKNGTDLVCSVSQKVVNISSDSASRSSSSSNIYLFLFVAMLVVALLLATGFVYYCRKANKEKLDDKIYETAYSNTGALNF